MYSNILVPVAFDHDRNASESLDIAKALAADGATITALHVMEDVPAYIAQYLPEGQLEQNRVELETRLKEATGDAGNVKTVVISGHPGHSIVEYAKEKAVDCIVIASHRPGFQDWLLGSTAARVVRHAHCSVHVCR